MLSVGSLAVGYLLMNIFSTSSNLSGDVCSTLFGSTSILTLTESEVYLSVILSVIVVLFFIFFYNKIFAVTFDESFARATGIRTSVYNIAVSILTAVTVVVGMRMLGTLLISALIIFPSLTSMRVCKRFKTVVISSVVISVLCVIAGLVTSFYFDDIPVGATIVIYNLGVFLLFSFAALFKKLSKK